MRCEEVLAKLEDYSYGELAGAHERNIAAHLRDCFGCYASYQQLRKETELFAQYARDIDDELDDVSPQLWQGVKARLNAPEPAISEIMNGIEADFFAPPTSSTRGLMTENIFTFVEAAPFWSRFAQALQEARQDFAADPKQFILDIFRVDPLQAKRKQYLRMGATVAMFFWCTTSILYVGWTFWRPAQAIVQNEASQPIYDLTPITLERPPMPKKPEKAGGGGGGGKQEQTPPSKGRLPEASLRDPIVSPSTHEPAIKNPELPVMPTVKVDPDLIAKQSPDIPLGLPNGVALIPSDGPGRGGGIGDGKGGAVGSGNGYGIGPGNGYNMGGGPPNEGGDERIYGGPGDNVKSPTILSKEKPKYTEEARRDKIQGVVILSAVFNKDGTINDVKVIRGLGFGLDEEAVKAALKIRFIPGTKDGKSVNVRARLEFTFSLL
jgi:periplasmic protein TonB